MKFRILGSIGIFLGLFLFQNIQYVNAQTPTPTVTPIPTGSCSPATAQVNGPYVVWEGDQLLTNVSNTYNTLEIDVDFIQRNDTNFNATLRTVVTYEYTGSEEKTTVGTWRNVDLTNNGAFLITKMQMNDGSYVNANASIFSSSPSSYSNGSGTKSNYYRHALPALKIKKIFVSLNSLTSGTTERKAHVIRVSVYNVCDFKDLLNDCSNVLLDGGMEQQPISSFWFPDTSSGDGRYSFGRMDSNILGAGAVFGSAICGEGQQVIGNVDCWPSLSYIQCEFLKDRYADIRQRFYWPGGILHYEFSAKGRAKDNYSRNIAIRVYIKNLLTQEITLLRDDNIPNNEWVTRTGSTATSKTAGNYMFYVLLRGNAGNTEGDSFIVDDVIASRCPLDGQPCSIIEPATTTTATIPVPTTTVTPNGYPGENLIENCGFEQGPAEWEWQKQLIGYSWVEKSFVIYSVGNNYGHINYDSYNPGIKQAFYWPGGNAYLSFKSDTNYMVYFRNRSTGAITDATSGEYPFDGFTTHYSTVYLAPGSYYLSLHHPAGSSYSQYDDIALSAGNYGTCGAGSNITATPPATATSNATATMWPTWTQQATRTVGAGTPTPTRIPSFTPYPTYTPIPTQAITRTPTSNPTYTLYPTYTARPTYTPQPTYTPNAQGTIEASQTPTASPPPPELPPPPSYYSDCQRPATGGEIAGWLEYQKCQMLSFFYMSPNAVATYAAIPTAFGGKEPFGTLNEVQDTNGQMKELVDSYDWDNTGLPGTDDTINLDQFLTPTGPLIDGQFDFGSNPGPEYSYECDVAMAELVGPFLAQGVCFILNILRSLGIMPWLQLVVNISAIGFLAIYIWKKWIDAGAGG